MADNRARRWDAVYANRGAEGVSWYQDEAGVSLELIEALAIATEAAVLDVGGGASVLADQLVARGFEDVSVLDVSAEALAIARSRVGATPAVRWLHVDLLQWRPSRRFDLWHDRAVLHFLVEQADREVYRRRLREALRPAGALVVGTFSLDGPDMCSGLPVSRYSPAQLAAEIGADFELVETRQEEHVTPAGVRQPFTWVAGRLRAD